MSKNTYFDSYNLEETLAMETLIFLRWLYGLLTCTARTWKKGGEVELSTLPSTWMRIHKIATEGVKWPKYPWWFLKIPNLSKFQKITLGLSYDLVKLELRLESKFRVVTVTPSFSYT